MQTATDQQQVDAIRAHLKPNDADNIYAFYAIGKYLEDIGQWDDAFDYYQRAGDAATAQSDYKVADDVDTIEAVIKTCDADWLQAIDDVGAIADTTPIFVVGLPRSGTTLVERILSSHSDVASIGESFCMQSVIKSISRVSTTESMSAQIIEAAASKGIDRVSTGYMASIAYRLGDEPFFIEKLPENFLYLGFIAKAFPRAKIVHVSRNPLDSCFALFKQSYFRFAYNLDDLATYYIAHQRLYEHWKDLLADRLLEVRYEELVANQDRETRLLLDAVGVGFQEACLYFEQNRSASNTASAVQVREKVHSRSVGRWRKFEKHLRPLVARLQEQGIPTD